MANACTRDVSSLIMSEKLADTALDPDQVLRPPFVRKYTLDTSLKQKISAYLAVILGLRRTEVALRLPWVMALWGKMRIRGGGDGLRTAHAFRRTNHLKQRNNTCIRVSRVI